MKYVNLLKNIKRIATSKGLTLKRINEAADFFDYYIYSWRNYDPSMRSIKKVANILDVPVCKLIDNFQQLPMNTHKMNKNHQSSLIFSNIKRIAKFKHISLNELSALCRLSPGVIYHWQYSSPRIDSLQKVANILQVPITDIIKDNDFNTAEIDLNDNHLNYVYCGKHISEEYLELIRQLLATCLNN